MMQIHGNIEAMEYLVHFLHNWLEKKNRIVVAGYYYSRIENKHQFIRIDREGKVFKDSYQESMIGQSIRRNLNVDGLFEPARKTFNHQFIEKFYEFSKTKKGNNIYICSFRNHYDLKNDLLFIDFLEVQPKIMTGKSGQVMLNIDEEENLQNEIIEVAMQVYRLQTENFEQISNLKELYEQKNAELQNMAALNSQMQEAAFQYKLKRACTLLDDLAKKYGTDYQLDDEAKRKIVSADPEQEQFAEVLKKAFINSLNLNYGKDIMLIKGEILYFEEPEGLRKSKAEEETRLKKVEAYLNKLEQAAVVVMEKGEKMTGENLGRKCDPPLIPAAISDYNKRHQERIRTIMLNRVDDWPVIRKEFRPIKKLLPDTNPPEGDKTPKAQGL